ncbi:MAG: tetratricopeptide repeat protein [Leptolyngbyaceae cyanobacterium RU_5_1]|nr:tetratricopeptide repeat protein [Leptolyngbyaceae cyanobacterium RU_5_1]
MITNSEALNVAFEHYEAGRLSEAEQIYGQISQVQPENVELMQRLAYLACQLNKFDQAIASYQKALELNPDSSVAALLHNDLGNVLIQQGKFEEAAQSYRRALKLNPTSTEAHNNLGNVLNQQGKFEEAAQFYRQALQFDPNSAEAYNNLGNIFIRQGKFEQAIQAYQNVLKLSPNSPAAHRNFGNALEEVGRFEEAMQAYQDALKLDPSFADARFSICMGQLPIIYASLNEIQVKRECYQHHLNQLAGYYHDASPEEQAKAADAVGTSQPFWLTYQGLNNRCLQQTYGALIHQLMVSRYPTYSAPIPLPKLDTTEKIRIGFVSGFFREHSNWKIPIKGWAENLDRSEFELFGYHTGSIQDQETLKAAKVFDKFIQGPLLFEQWCEAIIRDRLHILIFPEFGMDPTAIKLGCLRLTAVQIASWGHPETSGLPTMDYYVSSDLMEPENAQDYYTEKLVRLPNLSIYYTPLELSQQPINRTDLGIEDDDIMFWCCQSLYKYLPQHDDVFPQIAKDLRNAKFVFINGSNEHVTTVFRQRLNQAFQPFGIDYQAHCVFLPRMNPKKFAGITALADIFLDSIGWSGCNSTLESIAHNIPVVTLPGDLMRGRHTMAILKLIGIAETIATSKEDYVNLAIRLGQDAAYRQSLSEKIAENKPKLYGDLTSVRALEEFLLKTVGKPRRSEAEIAEALRLAIQHHRRNELDQAEQIYHQILAKQPNHAEALHGLGTLAQQNGQYAAAERFLNAALQVQPNSIKSWFSLGNLYQAQGQFSKAIAPYQQAIALRPDAAPIYNNLGYALQHEERWEDAIACYQKALQVQPNCVEAEANLGNALHAQGQLSPEQKAHYAVLNHRLGLGRQKAGDLEIAIVYYQQAINLKPTLTEAHHCLQTALQERG